jgi:hypothetical protein
VRVWVESGNIKAEGCSACGECVTVNIQGHVQAYKWVHVGVTVDCLAHNLTLTVTPWKASTTHVSGHIDSPLIAYYPGNNCMVNLGGFAVSSI